MNLTIIGSGYVGLVTGACLADIGNDVFCLDLDQRKIDVLNSGGVPIHEPGLQEIIARNRKAGRLKFSTDAAAAVAHGDIQFIAVGTPSDEDGSADLQYVLAAARNIGRHMTGFKVIVDKSTVPVGTAVRVRNVIAEELAARGVQHMFSVVSNPEFLKEGAAVEDFTRPDRIVLGCDEDVPGEKARELMKRVYAPFNRNRERTLYMDVRSAEFTKYAANAMLATRISFMNELANLADRVGADIEAVRRGIGSDPRIGYDFLYAGCGYGGSCFPKDVQALINTGVEHHAGLRILEAVEAVNETQKKILAHKIVARLGDDLSGRTFGVWGLAFKPNTDDMREAPSRPLIAELLKRGARVKAYDPVAVDEAKRVFALDLQQVPQQQARLTFENEEMDVARGADALVILTEWKVFKSPDFGSLKQHLKTPLIFDGRNLYEPEALQELGIEYHAIGRQHAQREATVHGAAHAASTAGAAATQRVQAKESAYVRQRTDCLSRQRVPFAGRRNVVQGTSAHGRGGRRMCTARDQVSFGGHSRRRRLRHGPSDAAPACRARCGVRRPPRAAPESPDLA
jgi:UDPglucose 6-dehydrogenase